LTVETVNDLERARELVRDTYREEIKLGLRHVSKIIQKETLGLGSPIDLAFRLGLAPDIRKRVFKQIDLVIDNAEKLDSGYGIEDLLDGNFENYMRFDLTVSYLRKHHEKFPEIKDLVKQIYKHRIELAKRLLTAHKNGVFDNYDDLARMALPIREEAEKALDDEIKLSNKVIEILKKYPDLIFAPPIIQGFGLTIVEQLMTYGNDRKKSNLDKIYHNGVE